MDINDTSRLITNDYIQLNENQTLLDAAQKIAGQGEIEFQKSYYSKHPFSSGGFCSWTPWKVRIIILSRKNLFDTESRV